MVMVEPEAPHSSLVTIEYEELLDGSVDLSGKIERAYGQGALGILTVSGVPELVDLRRNLLPQAHKFSELPAEAKDLYEDPDSFWSFGWSQGRETLQDGKPDMHKGSFYANPCSDKPTEDPVLMKKFPSYCRPNIWPSEEHAPGLEAAFKSLSKRIVDVGLLVAQRCDTYVERQRPGAASPGIHDMLASSCCHKARLLHYFPPPPTDPSCASPNDSSPWCGMHRDHCALTGLTAAIYTSRGGELAEMPDPEAGLYVETRRGSAAQVCIPPGHIAYQVGEVVQVLSGGLLCATPHYVQAPKPQLSQGIGRNTLAVFMQPHWDTRLEVPGWADEASVRRGKGLEGWTPGATFGDFTKATLANYH